MHPFFVRKCLFCQNLTREKLLLYEKRASKTLMKLTPERLCFSWFKCRKKGLFIFAKERKKEKLANFLSTDLAKHLNKSESSRSHSYKVNFVLNKTKLNLDDVLPQFRSKFDKYWSNTTLKYLRQMWDNISSIGSFRSLNHKLLKIIKFAFFTF